jgi:hypothetical protein
LLNLRFFNEMLGKIVRVRLVDQDNRRHGNNLIDSLETGFVKTTLHDPAQGESYNKIFHKVEIRNNILRTFASGD